jgi:hypothetical protein
MSRIGTSYVVGKATRVCAGTGRQLAPGEPYVGVLVQSLETGEMARVDYSTDAWEAARISGVLPREGAEPVGFGDVLGFWRARVAEPGAGTKKRLVIDDAALLELFEQLGDESLHSADTSAEQQSRKDSLRYILALILLRKRLLTSEGKAGPDMVLRARGNAARAVLGDGEIRVLEPTIGDDEIGRLTSELESVIAGEPEGAGGAK